LSFPSTISGSFAETPIVARHVWLLVVGLCLCAAPVMAQNQRVSGPFSGLFGGGGRTTNSQSLTVRASLFGVQQDIDIPSDVDETLLDPRFQRSGRFAGASSSMDYYFDRRSEGSSLNAGASGSLSAYSIAFDEPLYQVATYAGVGTKLTRRISFSATGQGAYSSTYSFTPLAPSGSTAIDPSFPTTTGGFASLALANVVSSGELGLSANLSQRSTLSASLFARRTFFIEASVDDLTAVGSTVTFSHRIFRRLNFRASYRREQNYFGPLVDSRPTQSVDFGLDYGDALSLRLSRRTTLSLAVSAGSARALTGRTEYRVLGNATLAHSMGRTWMSTLVYARTLGFVSAFQEPVLQDNLIASLGGQLGTRISVSSSAAISRGYIGLDTSRSFDTYSVGGLMSIALTRRISGFAQYTYYGNRVPESASTLPLLSTFARRSAVVGLSLWAPLYTNPRVRR
jgi:hypothetical protein